jgi:EpsI family protein
MISGMRAQYSTRPKQPIETISQEFAGVRGVNLTVDSAERRVAGMTEYVLREFRLDSAHAFSVYVGYYDKQVQGKTIHSPKNCLPGAGWDILQSEKVLLLDAPLAGTVNRVLLANKGTRAVVYYWYQGRGRIEANEYKVKWNLLRDAALFGRTEEALVRIVVPVVTVGDDDHANRASFDVANALAQKVASKLANEVLRVMPAAPGDQSAS